MAFQLDSIWDNNLKQILSEADKVTELNPNYDETSTYTFGNVTSTEDPNESTNSTLLSSSDKTSIYQYINTTTSSYYQYNTTSKHINTTSYQTLVNATLEPVFTYFIEIDLRLAYLLVYVLCDMFATVGYLVVFFSIALDKKKTFSFMLLANHALCRAFYAMNIVILGAYRLDAFYNNPNIMYITRFNCHTLSVMYYVFTGVTSLTTSVLAFDRLYALTWPMKYRDLKPKHAWVVNISLFVFIILIKLVPSYFSPVPLSTKIFCSTSKLGVSEQWWAFHGYSGFGFALIGLVIYMFLFGTVIYRRYKANSGGGDEALQATLRRQMKVLKIFMMLIIINVLTTVPANIITFFSSFYTGTLATRLVVYGACFHTFDRDLEVVILFVKSTDLRNSFKNVFCKQNSKNPNGKSIFGLRSIQVQPGTTVHETKEVSELPSAM